MAAALEGECRLFLVWVQEGACGKRANAPGCASGVRNPPLQVRCAEFVVRDCAWHDFWVAFARGQPALQAIPLEFLVVGVLGGDGELFGDAFDSGAGDVAGAIWEGVEVDV
jgi:hypothetical protein